MPDEKKEQSRERIPGQSGKADATDIPSWARGQIPKISEDGQAFAKRVMADQYGKGNWESDKIRRREFRKIKKNGDRAYRIPQDIIDQYSPGGASEKMMTVMFVLVHEYDIPGYEDELEEKDIGLYSTREKAEEAILRLKDKPGFRKYPDGFRIYTWPVDRDGWESGFLSMSEMMEDLP